MLSFADFDVELSFFTDWQLADLSSEVFFAVFCSEEGKFFGIALIATVFCFGLDFITWQVVTFPFVHLDALFFSEVLELELLTFSEKKKSKKKTRTQ